MYQNRKNKPCSSAVISSWCTRPSLVAVGHPAGVLNEWPFLHRSPSATLFRTCSFCDSVPVGPLLLVPKNKEPHALSVHT